MTGKSLDSCNPARGLSFDESHPESNTPRCLSSFPVLELEQEPALVLVLVLDPKLWGMATVVSDQEQVYGLKPRLKHTVSEGKQELSVEISWEKPEWALIWENTVLLQYAGEI